MKFLVLTLSLFFVFQSVIAAASDLTAKCFIKPCELKGDFDGDGKIDQAILVQNKIGKLGILFKFSKDGEKSIGAGRAIGNGGDNFDWMDRWTLKKTPIEQGVEKSKPPLLKRDSILLEKTMSASGIVYWNGIEFKWYQQGD